MIRKLVLIFAFFAVISCFFYFQQHPQRQNKETVSGAYAALNFMGAHQIYPFDKLPERAQYAAWEGAKQQIAAEKLSRSNVDPWESLGPHNRAGRILDLAFNPQNPTTMYAGSASGGLWRSYTGGMGKDAWERVETGFPVLAVSSIAFVPGDSMTMYIGTGEVYNYQSVGTGAAFRNTRGSYGIGILKSTDGGLSWEKSLDWSFDQNRGVWAIKIAFPHPNIVYAATTEGVYKSNDSGASWDLFLDVVMATDLLIDPNDFNIVVAACGNFASPGFGIYRTENANGGGDWVKITAGLPPLFNGKIQLALAPSLPDFIYASIGDGFTFPEVGVSWLCRSENFGLTWTIKSTVDYSKWQGWFSHDVAVNPVNPSILMVVGFEVWKSINGGQTILKQSGGNFYSNPPIEGPDGSPNYVHPDAHAVVYHPTSQSVVYIASDGGIHRSADGGKTYHSANGRLQTAQFYNGTSNSNQDSTFYIGGLQDNGVISWNGNLTWSFIGGGDGGWTATNPQNDSNYYISTQNLNIVRIWNGGLSSSVSAVPRQDPVAFIAPFVNYPGVGNILYAGSSIVAKTTNGGIYWTTTNNGAQLDGNPALSMAISHQNSDVVYVGTAPFGANRGHLFVTVEGGSSWNDITADLPDRFPMDLAVDPTDNATAYVTFSGFGSGHVFKTIDFGESWQDISGDLPDVPANAVIADPLFPNHIYVGNDIGVFVTTNEGESWEAFMDGLPTGVMAFDLKISPVNRKLRVATHGSGAWQRDLLEETVTSVAEVGHKNPFQVEIFPNPFVEQTVIRYQLSGKEDFRVEIVDGTGRLIKTLFNGRQTAGKHELPLEANGWSAGIYYCQFRNNEQVLVKKLVLAE